MQDPKQQWLFNYMDPDYDINWDDMESAGYDELLSSSTLSAEYDAYLDSLDE
jgi:polyphosphate kinase 2 (PPK2 family)